MSYYLNPINIERHNEETKHVWDAYHSGKPIRVPMILGINPRIYLLNSELNTKGISFQQYSEDPDIMADVQLQSQYYIRHNMLQDAEMGLPKDGWHIYVDLQNYYEAAWFGAKVEYRDGQVPDATPFLHNNNKRMLFDRGLPDPFKDGIMAKNWRFYEHFKSNMSRYNLSGLPVIGVFPSGFGTDGVFTLACSLRGATEICMELYEDPDYAHELFQYLTEAIISRIKAFRKELGQETRQKSLGFADDSIELLSVDMYKEFVLPYHKMLIRELAEDGPNSMHLCGNVGHLMPVLKQELNLNAWDAGFPVDYAAMRNELGNDFQIATGPTVSLLLHGTPNEIDLECRKILESGIMNGGKFILRDANNLSPETPVENVVAMYEAARKYGRY